MNNPRIVQEVHWHDTESYFTFAISLNPRVQIKSIGWNETCAKKFVDVKSIWWKHNFVTQHFNIPSRQAKSIQSRWDHDSLIERLLRPYMCTISKFSANFFSISISIAGSLLWTCYAKALTHPKTESKSPFRQHIARHRHRFNGHMWTRRCFAN